MFDILRENIKKIRLKYHQTEKDFGLAIGLTQGHLNMLEKGKRGITEKKFPGILAGCLKIGATYEEIFEGILPPTEHTQTNLEQIDWTKQFKDKKWAREQSKILIMIEQKKPNRKKAVSEALDDILTGDSPYVDVEKKDFEKPSTSNMNKERNA